MASILAPNDTYYALRFPSLETAKQLIEIGVCRIVLPATHFEVRLLDSVQDMFAEAGVKVVYQELR